MNIILDLAKKISKITNYTLLLLLASTGMRKGEAHALKWNNINYRKKTIKIEHTRDYLGVRSPKTKNSYREIPIDDILIRQLKLYHTWCKKKNYHMENI